MVIPCARPSRWIVGTADGLAPALFCQKHSLSVYRMKPSTLTAFPAAHSRERMGMFSHDGQPTGRPLLSAPRNMGLSVFLAVLVSRSCEARTAPDQSRLRCHS